SWIAGRHQSEIARARFISTDEMRMALEIVLETVCDDVRDKPGARDLRLMTTGDPAVVSEHAAVFWPDAPEFVAA
ncbi:MAG: hypothetical protein AAFR60_13040, partial [Pseudomonadota bacterium]